MQTKILGGGIDVKDIHWGKRPKDKRAYRSPEEQHKSTRYVEIGECYEASLASVQTFSTMATTTISAVRRQTDNKGQFKCQRCGKHHSKGECKALKVKCHKCDRVGHFAKMCKTKTQGKQSNNKIHKSQT